MSNLKKTAVAAICVALCLVLPWAFHAFPPLASIISPMHIPVLLCGLVCGPIFGLLTGVLGPILSSVVTGMPMVAYLPTMIAELAAYGLISGLLYRFVRTRKAAADIYISLAGAMLLGRVVAAVVSKFIFQNPLTMESWLASYFVSAAPGIIIQLILIPLIVVAAQKAKIVEKRY